MREHQTWRKKKGCKGILLPHTAHLSFSEICFFVFVHSSLLAPAATPAPSTDPWRTFFAPPRPQRGLRLRSRRPIHRRRLPPPACRHRSYFAFPSTKLVKVNLLRQSGASAFTRHYMVNMFSREHLLHDTAIFVSDGHQIMPMSGSTDLEPSDLLGTSLSPPLQVPIATLGHPYLDPPAPPPTPGVHALHDNILVASENPPPADPHVPPTAPCPQLLARLNADQLASFLNLWDRLPAHLRDIIFDLYGSEWSTSVIDSLRASPPPRPTSARAH